MKNKPEKLIGINTARKIIANEGGKFFKAKFVKKDNTIRVMNCRRGVTKHLKGGKSTIAGKDNLVSVYDMQAEGYRSINLDTLLELDADGVHYIIDTRIQD